MRRPWQASDYVWRSFAIFPEDCRACGYRVHLERMWVTERFPKWLGPALHGIRIRVCQSCASSPDEVRAIALRVCPSELPPRPEPPPPPPPKHDTLDRRLVERLVEAVDKCRISDASSYGRMREAADAVRERIK